MRVCLIFLICFSTTSLLKGQCDTIDFIINPRTNCIPVVIEFNAIKAPAGSSFIWDFGDGTSEIKPSFVKKYEVAGNYNVRLVVTLPGGDTCSIVKNNIIKVFSPLAVPAIHASDILLCKGVSTPVEFTNASPHVAYWNWLIGGVEYKNAGNKVTHTFGSIGCKDITLEVEDSAGCKKSNIEYSKLCIYDSVSIDLKLESCGVLKRKLEASFTNESSIDSYSWTFPGGSPAASTLPIAPEINYSKAGDYTANITVKTKAGCSYTKTQSYYILDKLPSFSVSNTSICVGGNILLNNVSEKNVPGTYIWNAPADPKTIWKSGVDSTMPAANLVFLKSGTHEVFLSYDKDGCSLSSEKKTINVLPPDASFKLPDTICTAIFPRQFKFRSDSKLSNTSTNTFLWTFYDKDSAAVLKTSTDENTFVTYNSMGNYFITLAVSSSNGCTSIAAIPFSPGIFPVADFHFSDTIICKEKELKLFDNTIPSVKYPHKLIYQSPDTIISTEYDPKSPPLVFPHKEGLYTVTYIVPEVGCPDTIIKLLYLQVNGIDLTIEANPSSACTVPFNSMLSATVNNNYHSPDNSENIIYKWASRGNIISSSDSAKTPITFVKENCHPVEITATNSSGCLVKKSIDVNVGLFGIVCLLQEGGCISTFCRKTFYPTIYYSCRNDILHYKWWSEPPGVIFSNDTIPLPNISFPDTLNYSVSLKVNTSDCVDTIKTNFTPPDIYADFFSHDTLKQCDSSLVTFYSNISKNAINYQWNFGDSSLTNFNSPTEDKIVSHHYNINPDGYNVILVVSNDKGCNDTLVKKQYIKVLGPVSKINILNKTGCDSIKATFVDNSSDFDKYILYFDKNNISEYDTSFKHISTHDYYLPQNSSQTYITFHPLSILTDKKKCTVYRLLDTVTVFKKPEVKFESDLTQGCTPLKVQFTDSSIAHNASYLWDFGDGDTSLENQPFHIYQKSGLYDVSLKISMAGGCNSISEKEGLIYILPYTKDVFLPNAFSPNGDGENDTLKVRGGCIASLFFIIYDRWGEKIFESNDPSIGWDGTYNGQKMNTGIYMYYISTTLFGGIEFKHKGSISLIR